MADTSCQSSLAGSEVIKKLGLTTKDLIPVHLKMHAADNRDINIVGATILRLSGKDSTGKEISTRQMVYITKSTDKLFLSREACTDLGFISPQFPKMNAEETDKANPIQSTNVTTVTTGNKLLQECDCPKRTKPPPPPTLPYPAMEGNREKLQQYLLDYYRASTFNVCEHQRVYH